MLLCICKYSAVCSLWRGKKKEKKEEKGNQPFQGKLSVAYKVELLSGVRGGGGGATLNVVTTRMTVP